MHFKGINRAQPFSDLTVSANAILNENSDLFVEIGNEINKKSL